MQGLIALTCIFITACLPFLNKHLVNRWVLQFGLLGSALASIALMFFVDDVKVFLSIYLFSQFLLAFAGFLLYPMIMLSVPQKYAHQVGGFPTCTRTIASSVI